MRGTELETKQDTGRIGVAEHTPAPWKFERGESAIELARLKGETLAEHEGYYRINSGAWIVTFAADDEDGFSIGGQVCEVAFKGKAKRGEAYRAPDPEGQANARLIAAAPDYDAFTVEALPQLEVLHSTLPAGEARNAVWRVILKGRAALSKARGEQVSA